MCFLFPPPPLPLPHACSYIQICRYLPAFDEAKRGTPFDLDALAKGAKARASALLINAPLIAKINPEGTPRCARLSTLTNDSQ